MNGPIVIEVIGIPQPAGSKRGFAMARKGQPMMKDGRFNGRVVVTDANPKSADWKETVKFAAVHAMTALDRPFSDPLLQGPLEVSIVFRMPRIKGHYKVSGELKPNAPERPPVRPDLLKLARGVEDALTGIVWRDDSQIVIERLEKIYTQPIVPRYNEFGTQNGWVVTNDKPGATITITPLEQPAKAPDKQKELV